MIEIYGIATDQDAIRCHTCDLLIKRLDEEGIEYVFKTIIRGSDNELGFTYDRPVIAELRDRIKKPKGVLTLPYVFIDGQYVGGAKALNEYLDL
ncbi:hypothetical protein OBDJBBDK_00119 [Aeromonas phage AhFM11]|nr:hypothetical protein OBDJBBDK_00119 [Aeromonas phage AhFM11]